MTFTIPTNALIVVADGRQAAFYTNTGTHDVALKKLGDYSPNMHDGKGAAPLPNETSPNEQGEANFAKHLADDLFKRVDGGKVDALVLIADPQTLGQIRPSLHKEVSRKITGELSKTLTHASISEIESILTSAMARTA